MYGHVVLPPEAVVAFVLPVVRSIQHDSVIRALAAVESIEHWPYPSAVPVHNRPVELTPTANQVGIGVGYPEAIAELPTVVRPGFRWSVRDVRRGHTVAVLLRDGIIDRGGQFVRGRDGIRFRKGRGRFVLVGESEAGGREIFLTQDDIDNVITAKAAVFAATKIMLERLNLQLADIDLLFLAGGFGGYIDRQNAIEIGLLPDIPVSRVRVVGNTSIWGATLAAFSEEACDTLRAIRARTTYYDLMGSPDYVEQFEKAMFLPHTDIQLFPSVMEQREPQGTAHAASG